MRRSSRSVEIGTRVRLLVAVVVVFLLALRFVSPRFSPSSSSSARRTAVMAEAQGRPGPLLGGVHDAPAGRENDLHTIELACFAVAEHNNKANAMLEFERLVKVRQQVVSGFMHYFTIEVKEGGAKKMYEAKVWEKAWENFKQLEEFKPVGDTASA